MTHPPILHLSMRMALVHQEIDEFIWITLFVYLLFVLHHKCLII